MNIKKRLYFHMVGGPGNKAISIGLSALDCIVHMSVPCRNYYSVDLCILIVSLRSKRHNLGFR